MRRQKNRLRLNFDLTKERTSAILSVSGRQSPAERAVLAAAALTVSLFKKHKSVPFYVHWTEELFKGASIQFEIAARDWTEFEALARDLGFDPLLRIEHIRTVDRVKIMLLPPEKGNE